MNGAVRTVAADDEARKRAIARAVWTEIHWLMPTDRSVAITVDGDAIEVEFGPGSPDREAPVHRPATTVKPVAEARCPEPRESAEPVPDPSER